MKNSILFLLILFIFSSCKSQSIEKGKIYNSIRLKNDTSLSYAIYIPKKANTNNLAFVFFDPHGDGYYPLSLYKNIAEQFGITLIGNNNSKNGMDFNSILSNFSKLNNEIYSTYKIDSKNICLWGFSGGGKAVMYCANNFKAINYCIYGGSYLPLQNPIECLGFNGTKDMNYTDLLTYDFAQETAKNNKHLQIEFSGKHAWCDTITAVNAFRWFILKKMQHNEIKKDNIFITKCYTAFTQEFNKALTAKKYRTAFLIGKKTFLCLNDLCDLSALKTEVGKLLNNPSLNKEMKSVELNYNKETTIKTGYQTDFLVKDTSYWSIEIAKLNKNSKIDNSGINERLLGYLSLASYSYAMQAFSQNNLEALEKILFIYQKSDPTNPEQAFMRARLFALKNNREEAKKCLQEAINLGIEQNRIDSDELLRGL